MSYWDNGVCQLYHADAREIPLPDQSVHCVVTSPPYYGLRVYQGVTDGGIGLEPSVDAYVANLVDVFREVWRVLRDDGVLWLNLGDSYSSSTGNHRLPAESWTTGGNPAPASETVAHGLCQDAAKLEPGNRLGIPERVVLALQADGWTWRDEIIWAKKSSMPESLAGWRWEPCRVKVGRVATDWTKTPKGWDTGVGSHDTIPEGDYRQNGKRETTVAQYQPCPGCPKCAHNDGLVLRKGSWRTTSSHEYIYMLTKKMSYYSDGESVKVKNGVPAIVQRPDFVGQSNHLPDDLWLQAPSMIGSHTPSGVSHSRLFRVAILAARAVFDIVQLDQDFSLIPLDSEEWQQLSCYFSGIAGGDAPTVKGLARFSLGFLHGKTSAEEFMCQLNSLGLDLAQMNLLSESGTNGLPLSLTAVNTDGEAPIRIEGTGDISQLNLSIHNNDYTVGTPTSLANRRSVWTDISPEPYGGSHYATFPSDLPRICIQASTSEKGCCASCGAQWARVVEREKCSLSDSGEQQWDYGGHTQQQRVNYPGVGSSLPKDTVTSLGWRPTCTCNAGNPVPALVLDPFCGTATTCLAAQRLGRRAVGVDLSEDYLKQAVRRLSGVPLPMAL